MGHDLVVEREGARIRLDGRDVAAWSGRTWTGAVDADWRVTGERYLAGHPRSGGHAEAQRLALLRRLAAGPAARDELLAALRTVGYVAAADLENRLRDLKAGDSRAAGRSGLAVARDGERWWLTDPFPLLDPADRRALGFAKGMVERLDSPMATRASTALDRLLPGVATGDDDHPAPRYRATPADFERFHEALERRRPVRVRYFSLNKDREGTYDIVPLEYVTLGPTVKAICVEVSDAGRSRGREVQFALDRLYSVEDLDGWIAPSVEELQVHREPIVLQVTDALYRVMRDRNLFAAGDATAEQNAEDDSWRVTGSFPTALAWDVMEQLCAWAGNAQVWEPWWLVNAVTRRLTAGLRVMEGAPFELVKPEVGREFPSHGDALAADALPAPTRPRKLGPRR